jgi:hypothetical protein
MVRNAELKEQADSLFLEDQRSGRLWRSASRTWSSTGFRKRRGTKTERMFLTKAARRSVNVTACVSGRSSDEGPTRRIHDQTPVQHTKKNWLIRKALAGDCGPILTRGCFGSRRAVRRLKEVLKSEGIRIPIPEDYGSHVGALFF